MEGDVPFMMPLVHPSICSPLGLRRKKSLSSKVLDAAFRTKTLVSLLRRSES
jgi:hypothetical protein